MTAASIVGVLALAAFLAALGLTGLMRAYAVRHGLLDQVNQRSSHSSPTPRGGGVSIVVVGLAGYALSIPLGLPVMWAVGLLGGGAAIGFIGWIDDRGHVSPLVRLSIHFGAAALAIWSIGPLALPFVSAGWALPGYLAAAASVLGVAWMINLYNFMDGIDGLAASQALCVTAISAAILLAGGFGMGVISPIVLVGAAAAGFLWWNWPPARIFMGDASSGFLGYSLAAFALMAGQLRPELGVAVLVLLTVFVADATITLIGRVLRRERLHEAHRMHAYQQLAAKAGRHRPVTLLVIGTNLALLAPVAWLVASGRLPAWAGLLIAYGTVGSVIFAMQTRWRRS